MPDSTVESAPPKGALAAWWSSFSVKGASKQSGTYFRLLFTSNPEPLDYVLLVVGAITSTAAGVPFPLLFILLGQLVDDLNSASCSASSDPSSITADVAQKVLMVVYVTIANFFLIYIHTGCWSLLGERLVRRLRKSYLDILLRQEVAFFDKMPAGEVASRLDVDLQTIQTGTSEKVGLLISSISYFVASYVVAFIKSARLAGMLFSLVPAFLLMALVGGHYTQKYASRVSDHVAAATAIASKGLANMPLIQAFGASSRLEAVFAGHLKLAKKEGIMKAFVASIQLGTLYFIAYSANALAFWQGSKEIAESVDNPGSGTTVGAVYTVIFVLVDASFIVSQVAPFMQLFASAASAFEKLEATIDRKSEIDGTSDEDGQHITSVSEGLEFQDVSFCYPSRPDVQVLNSFSLRIPANKNTALVGLSGSGKSTIAALVQRLYDPASGNVFLDGQNLRDLNVRCVRGLIGTVAQNSTLFDRSILENIAYGLVNSPLQEHTALRETLMDSSLSQLTKKVEGGMSLDDAVAQSSINVQKIVELVRIAAKDADALKFIDRLEHGLATAAGPGGNRLSGGQKQRIALSRALVRNPAILLLDEATASIDSVSERLIQTALDRVSIGRTTITIAHRLSTVKNAENIVVMGQGEILEQGSYAELLAKDGVFAGMVRLQSLHRSQLPVPGAAGDIPASSDAADPGEISTDDRQSTSSFEQALKPVTKEKTTERQPIDDGDSEKTLADDMTVKRGFFGTLFGILAMCRPYLLYILIGITGACLIGGSYSGEAVIFGHTVSSFNTCRGADAIRSSGNLWGLLFFMLALIEFFANVMSSGSFGRVSEKLLYKVRVQSLESLFSQSIQWHESEGRTPGTLISYISSDANSLSGMTGTILGVILSIIVSMSAGIILAHIIAWKIAVVLLACMPILLASGFLRLKILADFHERHQKAFAHSVSLATEAVESIKTVAIFSLEGEIAEVFRRSLDGPYKATLKAIAYGNLCLAMSYSVGNLVYALAYWWGAKQVADYGYTQLQFFTVLPALLFSAQLCGQMFSLAPDVSKAAIAAGRVLNLIEIGPSKNKQSFKPNDVESSGTLEKRNAMTGGMEVVFKDVRFSYPARPHIQVLHGLNLNIKAGSFAALVGPSGAGKSTVISLLERFYSPSSGSVNIDGADISRLDDVSFRDDIALVPQESVMFDGTLAFNLALGARPGHEATQEEIEAACRLANIHDTIAALPQGYETPCGSNGNQFSGGQMQRLSIARAMLRQPRMLILDEASSALDAESERLFEEALESIAKGITIIAIAHRLRTIRRADCIFVIEDGKCVDQGTHEELVVRNDAYKDNAMHQTLDH
ncbi:hypothetical protein BP6252_08278 [Coleophoma cylindrospora]|uniref:Leptomycin B resistance protein pmd1 n=1 Tax=Coleophoma cylindrospora TaxID=1849047 RepID=A0A3D8R5L5_9HELO|nr:hypothetical protein BP6252_08278 [Coleophoma cylindrospora]